jgi:hypothetical protein
MVACAVCGMKFDASPRAARNYAAGKRTPRCMFHRHEHPRPETSVAETRRWWLDRFTVAELIVMGWAVELTVTGREIIPHGHFAGDVQHVERQMLALAASADG